jgi:VIT1/CCC1 family predicted Fe2+/Mn2+ transporter
MANPQMTAAVEARVKKYGQWSVKEEKLRIIYDDSEESVLFEDTSSISYLKVENINPLYMFGGILLGCILGIVSMTSGDDVGLGMILMVGIMILGFILAYTNKIKYDNVAIETRGGKIIRFSVDTGKGKDIMEKIEEEKRKWETSKK